MMAVEHVGRRLTAQAVFEDAPRRVLHSERDAEGRLQQWWGDPPHVLDGAEDVPATFAEPEDMGRAEPSELAEQAYVEEVVRPGRITTFAAVEGTAKTTGAVELSVRVAGGGGSFAGTWPVLGWANVAYCSEQHRDDDLRGLDAACRALGIERDALAGKFYRVDPYTAADGTPPLALPAWREWFVGWCRERDVRLVVFDTATTATRIDPWGRALHDLFAGLRAMIAAHPPLAVVLLVHLSKPKGGGSRGLESVLGEWGRFNDVTLLMERDGDEHIRLTLRKRVRHERRIVCRKADGLLVEPRDAEGSTAKVAPDRVLAAIEAQPGSTVAELAAALGVAKRTAAGYVAALGTTVTTVNDGPRGAGRVYADRASAQVRATSVLRGGLRGAKDGESDAPGDDRASAQHPIEGARSLPARSPVLGLIDLDPGEDANDDTAPPVGWLS